MQKATQYIARKEDFQKALTDQGELRVIAVYPDGTTTYDHLTGYIENVRLMGSHWMLKTSTMKGDRELTLVLL